MLNEGSNIEEYEKLKINEMPSINQEDLPSEFTKEAFLTIDTFIKKTYALHYEWAIFLIMLPERF